MIRRGFTVVELIITITIMGILLLLAVVNVSSTQQRARDDERTADVQAIAANLEDYYRVGIPSGVTPPGTYPIASVMSQSNTDIRKTLLDVDPKSLVAPGKSLTFKSLIPATNATQTITGVTPQPTIDTYVYQPISSNGSLCTPMTDYCRKFNIYYRLEGNVTVQTVTSRRQ